MKIIKLIILFLFVCPWTACKKDEEDTLKPSLTDAEIQQKIIEDFTQKVVLACYQDMENKMNVLYNACLTFSTDSVQNNLENTKNAWKSVRAVWEQSEAFLFGPVSTENIDPSTDTWPVDFNSLDSLLQTNNSFTQTYLQGLGDELKGYHPLEYLLWGQNGNKLASQFTSREREYMMALASDLQTKATSLRKFWDPTVSNYFGSQLLQAGSNNSIYPSKRAVFEEIINSMVGICDEVANGKIAEPFIALDPSLEESPFSQNSLIDFKSNMQGVKNVYFGKYQEDGYGLHDFLDKNNTSLHAKISTQIENVLSSFNGVTIPFAQAISSQPTQIQNIINQINQLKTILEGELLPFMQQQVKD